MSPPMLPSVKDSAIQGSKCLDDSGLDLGVLEEIVVQAVGEGVHSASSSHARTAAAYCLQRGGVCDEQLHPEVLVDLALAFRFRQAPQA